jgi:hypothetical protein
LLNDRDWTIEIPLWIPGFRGNLAYGDISIGGEDGSDPGDPDDDDRGDLMGEIVKINVTLSGPGVGLAFHFY